MQRLFDFTLATLRHDPAAVAAVLSDACRRPRLRLSGVCQAGDRVCFVAVPGEPPPEAGYVIVPEEGLASEALAGVLAARWTDGFDAVGFIALEPFRFLAVYGRSPAAGPGRRG